MAFITRHCRIRQYTIEKQGEVFLRDLYTELEGFLTGAMKAMQIAYPKFYKMDHLAKLGFLGVEILLKELDIVSQYGPEGVALVLSNANASLNTDLRYFETSKTISSPGLFVYTLANIVTGEICIRNGIKGENAFFITPRFDPEIIAGYVESVMRHKKTGACIAGWVDVMGEHHDVFLYLAENQTNDTDALAHTPEHLEKLYRAEYGTVDGRS
ncbi:MAG: hypothetical protein WKF87_07315 [Chryseolinea sp.]